MARAVAAAGRTRALRVLEDTPERLVLEDRPWFLGLLLAGCILFSVAMLIIGIVERDLLLAGAMAIFGAGAWAAFNMAVRRGRLTLDRASGRAVWVVRTKTGLREESWDLTEIARAVLDTHDDEGVSYRPSLAFRTAQAPVALRAGFGPEPSARRAVEAINRFLDAPRK